MFEPVRPEKLEEMFLAYCENPVYEHVARTCQVSGNTVRKYADELNWDRRLAKIQKEVARRTNKAITERQVRKVNFGKMLQKAGGDVFVDEETGKVRKGAIRKPKDAIDAIKLGFELEDDALGDAGAEITIKVKLPPELEGKI